MIHCVQGFEPLAWQVSVARPCVSVSVLKDEHDGVCGYRRGSHKDVCLCVFEWKARGKSSVGCGLWETGTSCGEAMEAW